MDTVYSCFDKIKDNIQKDDKQDSCSKVVKGKAAIFSKLHESSRFSIYQAGRQTAFPWSV